MTVVRIWDVCTPLCVRRGRRTKRCCSYDVSALHRADLNALVPVIRRNTAGERGAAARSAEDGSYALTGTRTAQIRQLQLWKGACRLGCRRMFPQAPAHPCASPRSAPLSDPSTPLSRSMRTTLPLYRYPWHLPALAAPPVHALQSQPTPLPVFCPLTLPPCAPTPSALIRLFRGSTHAARMHAHTHASTHARRHECTHARAHASAFLPLTHSMTPRAVLFTRYGRPRPRPPSSPSSAASHCIPLASPPHG